MKGSPAARPATNASRRVIPAPAIQISLSKDVLRQDKHDFLEAVELPGIDRSRLDPEVREKAMRPFLIGRQSALQATRFNLH